MLKVGDKILILEDHHNCARVFEGDILEVQAAFDWGFQTDTPRLKYPMSWDFAYEEEGTGWEKWEETK
ncbi:hypothetical protein ASD97_25890 [Streptomyces sp. Root63]|nr:hypothetical protein ASD29_32195 [Streptomyces sp. Root1295]KRA34071.1 hypothetical protein ASD97_25890 [Streptomyces sp. Root63]